MELKINASSTNTHTLALTDAYDEELDTPSVEVNSSAPSSTTSKADAKDIKDPFLINIPETPTQEGPEGIRFDFNDGARIFLPQGEWHVLLEDTESGNIIFSADVDQGWVVSTKKYYVPFGLKVWRRGDPKPILEHTMNLSGQKVLIKFPVGTLGDILGWFGYAEKFAAQHPEAIVECTLSKELLAIFKDQYPQLLLSTPDAAQHTEPYASYRIGLYFKGDQNCQPIDFRMVGLHRTAGYILGVDPTEIPPKLKLDAPRTIEEPYVCIATMASAQAKFWNNGHGWASVVAYLKELGYKVICIDRDPIVGHGFVWNHIPRLAEDYTGNRPLQERVDVIQHADFFIGLSSGLSWLAWGCKVPVIMISGFTLPICEFQTPYRVFNSHGCTGCWDDINLNFDHHDFLWCPRHKGTDRQFECSRLITPKQVIGHIDRLMKTEGLVAPKER